MHNFIRLFNTVKFLKFKQIYFRLYYFIRNRYRKKIGFAYSEVKNIKTYALHLQSSIFSENSFINNKFTFLNLTVEFDDNINWNYSTCGKLWTYNLNYFDFLNQKNVNIEALQYLLNDFVKQESTLQDAIEPFPTSLRIMNWIKFFTTYSNENLNNTTEILYKHCLILYDNIEYHLLGNHLLENAFALLYAGYFFQNNRFYNRAKKILEKELQEQILTDGAHFELSPMYHQIMLFRILDSINLVKNNNFKNQGLLTLLVEKAELMLAWLNEIRYKDGSIPLFSDSALGIAPDTGSLFEYAATLELIINDITLRDSGYRSIVNETYECKIDIGDIGAVYIPGHAHADTFNFEIRRSGKQFIVDSGLSTYEPNNRRAYERSTLAHNCVEIKNKNSSDVWDAFRVANRAKVSILSESDSYIKAEHDGYKQLGIFHTRSWEFKENEVIIEDTLNSHSNAIFRLHFHPDIGELRIRSSIECNQGELIIKDYEYAERFNEVINAKCLEINFTKENKVKIKI